MNELKNLSSFALMSVNWEENSTNFIDLLKPFVIYGINPPSYEIISIHNTANKIKDNFGICMPKNVIQFVLNRLVKEKIIIRENNTYKHRTGYNLSKIVDPFIATREKHIREQEIILDEFLKYCKEKLELDYTREQAQKIVLNYLEKYSHNIFLKINVDEINIDESSNYIMGKFLEYLLEEKMSVYQSLEKIIKGFLIANSIYSSEKIAEDKFSMKFKETSIYFDTSFLFFALGYQGDELKESCIELINILIELGAKLKVNTHVVNEIENILDAYKNLYDKGKLEEAYDFDYFIENGITSTTIILYKSKLEENLYKLNIIVEETPEYKKDNVYINHKQLEEHLKRSIGYGGENGDISIRNDIESISSVYRIRKDKFTTNIEDCKAIFMTTNSKLVREVNYFIRQSEKSLSQQFPPIITDINLTGIAWLKLPTKYPNLPKKNIIADAYSLQQPSRKFWDSYIEKVNILLKEESITEEDALLLKYELSKSDLMEVTYGSEDKLSHKCILKIMDEVKLRGKKDLREELKNKEIKIKEQEKEIMKERRQKEDYINNKSEKNVNKKIKRYHNIQVMKNIIRILVTLIINIFSIVDLFQGKNRMFLFKIIAFFYLIYLLIDSNIYNCIKDIKNISKIEVDELKERYYEIYNEYKIKEQELVKSELRELIK